jgi:hypothetical protein
MLETVLRLWAEMGPEAQSLVGVTAAGILGAAATVALEKRPVMMPRVRQGALHLGFGGTLIISLVAAYAVDHGFRSALLAAVCGTATLRKLKESIDRGFEEARGPREGRGSGDG